MPSEESFEVTYNLSFIQVQLIGSNRYRVQFSNEVPPIIIESMNVSANTQVHWIDLSAGNDELAAGIGHLIEAHQMASK